jgi:hypothetical protein
MTTTAAQGLQHTLSNTELRAVLFAVQMEARCYKDIPTEDLPIEILTLLRAKSTLANIVHGLDNKALLMHEWEIFLSAMKLEAVRYEKLEGMERPKYVRDLFSALMTVRGTLMADFMNIQEAGKK